jgi:hypothetical protein
MIEEIDGKEGIIDGLDDTSEDVAFQKDELIDGENESVKFDALLKADDGNRMHRVTDMFRKCFLIMRLTQSSNALCLT